MNTGPEAWITLHEVVTSEKSSGSRERGGSGEGYNRETMSYVFGGSRGYQSLGGTDVYISFAKCAVISFSPFYAVVRVKLRAIPLQGFAFF